MFFLLFWRIGKTILHICLGELTNTRFCFAQAKANIKLKSVPENLWQIGLNKIQCKLCMCVKFVMCVLEGFDGRYFPTILCIVYFGKLFSKCWSYMVIVKAAAFGPLLCMQTSSPDICQCHRYRREETSLLDICQCHRYGRDIPELVYHPV